MSSLSQYSNSNYFVFEYTTMIKLIKYLNNGNDTLDKLNLFI